MTKILVLNVGWSNKGNRALVVSTIETIQKFVPDAEFFFVGPESVKNEIIEIKQQAGYWISLKKPNLTLKSVAYLIESAIMGLMKRFNWRIKPNKKSILFYYYNCDIVVNSGGDSTSGEYSIGAIPSLLNIAYANLMGMPVVCYGESLGYFNNPVLNFFANLVYNGTDLILVREELSQKYLYDNHITRPKIYLTADSAFLLNGVSQTRVQEILAEEGITILNKPTIGINPSGLIGRFKKEAVTDDGLAIIFARTIEYITHKMNANVILIPHVYSEKGDDRDSIRSILNYVEDKSRVQTITKEYDASELKSVIGLCELFIGARMHATIAALSQGIPTIGIAYSHKMYGIVGDMLGQQKYIIDIKDLNYEGLILKISDAWENREQIRQVLDDNMISVREKALSNGKYVMELINSSKKKK